MSAPISASARLDAVRDATSRSPRSFDRVIDGKQVQRTTEIFGANTFSFSVMEELLPRPVFKRLLASIHEGEKLDRAMADAVAHAVKEWALSRGVTHFTHWFQPMTGSTAEKHDSFIDFDSKGNAIERFSGSMLIQSEPDASSFPSGGMRTTFEARGYTAWDPSSPMFIMENRNGRTLCIPSVFISYHGHALDKKKPLLRSMDAISKASSELLETIGDQPGRVTATLGCEQEYFLIDRAYYSRRPDLAVTGRTLTGKAAPKGQSLDDHYFGSVPPRVLAVMQEVEHELYKLGVPAKTRHNEVAPTQFEIAPLFREANVAVDHNQLIMEVLRQVAPRHDFRVLMHEKPYAGVNGSGKHNNWSLQDSEGRNLLDPGDNPHENTRFMLVLSAILLGVYRYSGLLRCSVASHGNDFRLGANEAPPAIMSVFLGDQLTRVVEGILNGDAEKGGGNSEMHLGVARLPHISQDNTDRNRTSPFAFTGNKFEFRAVGSNQTPALPMTILNTVVAEAMNEMVGWIREAGGGPQAVGEAIRKALAESSPVRFEGDNYSDEWVAEAERRGLPNLRKAPEAIDVLKSEESISLFERQGVLSRAEVMSRYNVQIEKYCTVVEIEIDSLREIVNNLVIPAAIADRNEVSSALVSLLKLRELGVEVDSSVEERRMRSLTSGLSALAAAQDRMREAMESSASRDDHAHALSEEVVPAIEEIREAVDSLEGVVADGHWPLPKYREILFMQE